MKSLLTTIALSLTTFLTFATTCVSLGNGDWDNPLTWSCGSIPAPGDTIIISVGDTVTLNSTEILNGAPMLIVVNGYFLFDTPAAKLHLECGSQVIVTPTGEIASSGVGQPSHNIKICGQEVWQGFDGPLLGPVILASPGPLPIELVNFNVDHSGHIVIADWETASEFNNDYFTLQGSSNGLDWADLTYTDGAGTTNETQYYNSEYDNRAENYMYFRLQQTDIDGTSSYSDVVAVERLSTSELVAYPNPINANYLTLSWNSEIKNASVEIVDLNGRVIESQQGSNNGKVVLNAIQWESGYYIVQLKSDNGVESLKIIKP